ncbi:MAG: hypothetical protein ACOCXH_01290 [Cyclobacteriaceae bacterium]
MKNYIVIASFEDKKEEERFNKDLQDVFKEHKIENYGDLQYFAFPERDDPSVTGQIKGILHNYGIGTKDWVALYYTRSQSPDDINRLMILGHDDLVETKVEKISEDKHHDTLIELMNFDFMKARTSKS